jgi:anti-sigma factor RsiW
MTTDPRFERLRELSWRRRLTEAEAAELRAWLAEHPEAQADWEAEAGLNEALNRLPDAPVASNFTARVLQAIEREGAAEAVRSRQRWRRWWQPRWLVRAGLAAVILTSGLVALHVYHEKKRQVDWIERVAAVSEGPLPGPEALTNFEWIVALNSTTPDVELLELFR